MEVLRDASAGSLESSDVLVRISKSDKDGIDLSVESVVIKQFGKRIRDVAMEVVGDRGLSSAVVQVIDRGALEYTLRARLETAIERATAKDE